MKRERRSFAGEQKLDLLLRHLMEGVAVSQVCEEEARAAHAVLPMAEAVFRKRARRV